MIFSVLKLCLQTDNDEKFEAILEQMMEDVFVPTYISTIAVLRYLF